ncbi:MAG: hypothetical protein A2X94_06230 [Bdellovibrionales bacterium GWB1_55_8]|nr:MAG: hypothetical protein A2X94_06230 [Bdellovibrionales bacterium GWB1_55_8]
MNSETTFKFKTLFEEQKRALLCTRKLASEDFRLQEEDLADEMDVTSSELETSMKMRLRNREALFLKKIDQALDKIREGSFGTCDDCGDDIDLRRLEARPTATLCVSCKEGQERSEHAHIDGRKPKSLGTRIRLA